MNLETEMFRPIPTCEIPPPILEAGAVSADLALPRILLQAAGSGRVTRHVVMLVTLFLVLTLAEISLFFRIPTPEPIVVYGDIPRKLLMEGLR